MTARDRLDPDKISARLKTVRVGRKVVVYDRTASTNDIAAEYGRNPENDGIAVFAEEQTAGRGRMRSTWSSGHGESLLFSIALIGSAPAGELLSLSAAVAVAEAIGRIGDHHALIKWPNDVLVNGRKLVGILVENRSQRSEVGDQKELLASDVRPPISGVHVVGIGINCHQSRESFPPELQAIATSIDIEVGSRCDRTTVARRVLTSLDTWWATAGTDPKRVIETWSHLSTQLGRHVSVVYNGKRFAGHCRGVDPTGGLILQLDRGGVRMFDAAHTTIART
jgi:BirA family transcriptional regulator, biotin operon repressor / biotin---[acetyl-CoA-carboxylase] ligase